MGVVVHSQTASLMAQKIWGCLKFYCAAATEEGWRKRQPALKFADVLGPSQKGFWHLATFPFSSVIFTNFSNLRLHQCRPQIVLVTPPPSASIQTFSHICPYLTSPHLSSPTNSAFSTMPPPNLLPLPSQFRRHHRLLRSQSRPISIGGAPYPSLHFFCLMGPGFYAKKNSIFEILLSDKIKYFFTFYRVCVTW
jgi:hypothetical protein